MKLTMKSALGLALALLTAVPATIAAGPTYRTSGQKFGCGAAGTNVRYESLTGGDGFGPTNLFVHSFFGGTNPPGPPIPVRTSGYIGQAFELPNPPSSANGFRDFSLSFKKDPLDDGDNGINAARVEFTFVFPNGTTVVRTKKFVGTLDGESPLQLTPPDANGFQTAKTNSISFAGGLNVREANLVKYIPYIKTNNSQARIFFGEAQVSTQNDGQYIYGFLKYNNAPCPVVPLTPDAP